MEVLSDNSLMMKVKNGDLDMLGLLFERYHRMLYTFFYKVHRSSETSEDLVQNVFMRILKYRKGFNGDGTFKIWRFHIARNVSNDHFRKVKKRGYRKEMDGWEEKISDQDDINQAENKNDQISVLWKALGMLEQEKRELIVLSKLEGMKYKDIADIHGVTEGNIKIRAFRALKDLKSAYEKVQQRQDYKI